MRSPGWCASERGVPHRRVCEIGILGGVHRHASDSLAEQVALPDADHGEVEAQVHHQPRCTPGGVQSKHLLRNDVDEADAEVAGGREDGREEIRYVLAIRIITYAAREQGRPGFVRFVWLEGRQQAPLRLPAIQQCISIAVPGICGRVVLYLLPRDARAGTIFASFAYEPVKTARINHEGCHGARLGASNCQPAYDSNPECRAVIIVFTVKSGHYAVNEVESKRERTTLHTSLHVRFHKKGSENIRGAPSRSSAIESESICCGGLEAGGSGHG